MNLLLFFVCSLFGLRAFILATVIFMIFEIVMSFVLVPFGGWTGILWGIAKIIAFVVFIINGFPINHVLWFFTILYAISILAILGDLLTGAINIGFTILNIIGMILFFTKLL